MSGSIYAAAIAELKRGRQDVDRLITSLEQLEQGVPLLRAVSGLGQVGTTLVASAVDPPVAAPAAARAPVPAAGRTVNAPPKTEAATAMILEALKKPGGPRLMKELLAQANLSSHLLREGVKVLGKRKQVVITGTGRGKRVALPAAAAKEGL